MSQRIRKNVWIVAWLLATVTVAPMTFDVIAQESYPNRPIHLVVPYPPGALTDLLVKHGARQSLSVLGIEAI